VAGTATLGPRDVKVGGMTYEQGFTLESPLGVTVQGTAAQGSVATVVVQSRAFDITFDDTATGDGFFTPLEYTNFTMDAGEGLQMVPNSLSVSPYEARAMFFIDVTVDAGPRDITIESGPAGSTTTMLAPGAMEVAARTAMPIPLGTPATGMQEEAYGTQLYSVSPATGSVVDLRVSAASSEASAMMAVLPSNGRWDSMISFAERSFFEPASASDTFYLVYYDASGAVDYSYTVNAAQVTPAMLMDETTPEPANDSRETAQSAAQMPFRISGALDAQEDEDWFSFTVSAADAGRTITVGTYAGDATTDTVVQVLGPDGSPLGESDDASFLDSLSVSSAAGGGTHYVQIRHSTYPYDASNSHYRAIVKLD